jgi:penicillin-binding protein 1A
MDMAAGFSTFANRGVHNEPELISRIEQVDDDGDLTVLEDAQPTNDRVIPEEEADQVTHALRQVILGGTGRAANIGKPAAGKTGTTGDNRDAWFVGYTPKLTAAVWMGYDNPPGTPTRYMDDVHGIEVTGGSFPAQIWAKFMRAATAGTDSGSFTPATRFPGEILNPALVLTPDSTSSTSSTTPDPNASSTSSTPGGSSTSTTFPGGGTLPTTPGSTTPTGPPTTPPRPKCKNPALEWPLCDDQGSVPG